MSQFTISQHNDPDLSKKVYTITGDDGSQVGAFDLERLTALKAAIECVLPDAPPKLLSAESAGLEPTIAGGPVYDINGPGAVLLNFRPTRAELETLAYHYLDRHYAEVYYHKLGYSGSSEWREYEYTWWRFRAIEDVLSPDKEYPAFTEYMQNKRKQVDEDLVDAVKTIGFEVVPWEGTIRLRFWGPDYHESTACVLLTEETFRELLNASPSVRMKFELPQERIDELARQTVERIAERKERVRQTEQRIAETLRTNTEEIEAVSGDEGFLRALEAMERRQEESESQDAKRANEKEIP